MIRFFTRIGIGCFQTFTQPTVKAVGDRDIWDILRLLRECPTYQLDRYHSHCGIRNQLLQKLDVIEGMLVPGTGICGTCWLENRGTQRWSTGRQGSIWRFQDRGGKAYMARYVLPLHQHVCSSRLEARALFTAEERNWSG